MDIQTILTLVFGIATTLLSILLKAEYDKRTILQQQVDDRKRDAYSKFNQIINDFIRVINKKDEKIDYKKIVDSLMQHQKEIWQYGSDEVVKAYYVWENCMWSSSEMNDLSSVSILFLADLILKMRRDLRLSTKRSLTALDILRIFVKDIEDKYDDLAITAKKWRNTYISRKHESL